jgi:CBS domain-containing protein
MTTDVLCARKEDAVSDVASLMLLRGVSGVPVVDADGRVQGMVTELDLVQHATRLEPPAFLPVLDGRIPLETPGHYRERLRHQLGTRVADVMSEDVLTIGPEAELEDLADLLLRHRVSPVPVVEGGRLVGIVSRADVLRALLRPAEEPRE